MMALHEETILNCCDDECCDSLELEILHDDERCDSLEEDAI
jgi:hypothetical protein